MLCRYLLQGSTMLLDLVGVPPSEQNLQPIEKPRMVRSGGQYERRKDARVTKLLRKHTKLERRLYKLAKARFEHRRGMLGNGKLMHSLQSSSAAGSADLPVCVRYREYCQLVNPECPLLSAAPPFSAVSDSDRHDL